MRVSSIYDNNSYEVKGNKSFTIDGITKIGTYLYEVDKIQYTMIPVNIGVEYFILSGNPTPYIMAIVGYNFSNSEEQISKYYDGIAGIYDSIDEVPEEYKLPQVQLENGSSLTVGIGIGLRFNLSSSTKIDIRYVYNYNSSTININQFLIGLIL